MSKVGDSELTPLPKLVEKPFVISKKVVWDAYEKVKADRLPVSIECNIQRRRWG